MHKIFYAFCILSTLSFTACGQSKSKQNSKITNNKMDISKLTNETVKNAIEALQTNDKTLGTLTLQTMPYLQMTAERLVSNRFSTMLLTKKKNS